MDINEFEMVNVSKLRRVIDGTESASSHGLEGGLGADAAPELILAHYDKLGGLIMHGNKKVKTGSFWDVKAKGPRAVPKITYEFRSEEGNVYEYTDEEPVEVKAAQAKVAKKKKVRKSNE